MGQPIGDFPTPPAVMIDYLTKKIAQLNTDYDEFRIDVEQLNYGQAALYKVIRDLESGLIKFT